eukprot:TRINITY_DN8163_c1_g1_i1.p3 TRINITY_DN8163_c1_g1~~TRINITY_DN8163_c1_g1_i1.p3  ORF type:complete len:104 (-),score=19.96 TRINITY_DN8163_c1_g1_i1:131-442(-)
MAGNTTHGQYAPVQKTRTAECAALRREQGPPVAHPDPSAEGGRGDRLGRQECRVRSAEGGTARTDARRHQGRAPQEHGRPQDVAAFCAGKRHRLRPCHKTLFF